MICLEIIHSRIIIVILLLQHKLHERTQRESQRLAASRQSARGLSPLGNKHNAERELATKSLARGRAPNK